MTDGEKTLWIAAYSAAYRNCRDTKDAATEAHDLILSTRMLTENSRLTNPSVRMLKEILR